MKTLSEIKTGLLKDKATRDAYLALEDEFSIAHEHDAQARTPRRDPARKCVARP